jgi:hypothetical protein
MTCMTTLNARPPPEGEGARGGVVFTLPAMVHITPSPAQNANRVLS